MRWPSARAASAIATAGAAGTTTSTTQAGDPSAAARAAARRALLRRGVQGDVVVATRSGFATVTFDRGFVQAVSGQQLTIREGTKKATYKTVTLTIPAGAKVRDNGQAPRCRSSPPASGSGSLQGPNRTLVIAPQRRS